MNSNTVAIVGAGPAGLATAIRLKEEGFDSLVFEEHEKIGIPEHCSGLISKKGVLELGLHLGETLQNEVKGAKIFSPNGTMLKVEKKDTVAYVVDRKAFDQMLLRKARLMNIHVATHTKLIDVRKSEGAKESTVFVQVEGRGELRKATYIVGADGVNSTVRHLLGINVDRNNYVHTIQSTCTGSFDSKFVEIHFGDFAKGFFGWMVPISKDKAKIGLGSTLGDNVAENFQKFLHKKFPGAVPHSSVSALIPYGPPLTNIYRNNMALVGDAAFQAKATTGGGVIFGMKAGNILAETLSDSFKKKANMNAYEKRLSALNRELKMHWKIRSYINSLGDDEIDALFAKLKSKGIEAFLEKEGDMDNPSSFVGKLAKKPAYWFMAGTLLAIARS